MLSELYVFHFSDEWKLCVTPKRRDVYPYKPRSIFSEIMATTSQLNHFCMDLKLCMCSYLDMLELLKGSKAISDIYDVFMTSPMSYFYIIL